MNFDPVKDVVVVAKDVEGGIEGGGITVSISKYDGGAAKVRITRFFMSKKSGKKIFNRMGGLTVDEWAKVKEAIDQLWAGVAQSQ